MKNFRHLAFRIIVCLIAVSAAAAQEEKSGLPAGLQESDQKSNALAAMPNALAPKAVHVFGSAPGMRFLQTHSNGGLGTWLIVFKKGDDIIAGLNDFAVHQKIEGGYFNGIGGVHEGALGFFELSTKTYKVVKLAQQLEVASLSGNIALSAPGKYMVHAHAVLSDLDGRCFGGHVLYASVNPTLEVIFTETRSPLKKSPDQETGAMLYHLK